LSQNLFCYCHIYLCFLSISVNTIIIIFFWYLQYFYLSIKDLVSRLHKEFFFFYSYVHTRLGSFLPYYHLILNSCFIQSSVDFTFFYHWGGALLEVFITYVKFVLDLWVGKEKPFLEFLLWRQACRWMNVYQLVFLSPGWQWVVNG
jgi:hypothetical protein